MEEFEGSKKARPEGGKGGGGGLAGSGGAGSSEGREREVDVAKLEPLPISTPAGVPPLQRFPPAPYDGPVVGSAARAGALGTGDNAPVLARVTRNLRENFDAKLLKLRAELLARVSEGQELSSKGVEALRTWTARELESLERELEVLRELASGDTGPGQKALEVRVAALEAQMREQAHQVPGVDVDSQVDAVREAFAVQVHQLKRENKKLRKKLEAREKKVRVLEARLEAARSKRESRAGDGGDFLEVASGIPPESRHPNRPEANPPAKGDDGGGGRRVRFCTNCGRPRKNLDARFCTSCGNAF
ncbi:MAG: hypothetical protein ACTSU5_03125 [Promethearchaeota archaeon]